MAIQLPDLPWPSGALDPYVSARTIDFHYGKHHATYVTKLNQAIEGSALANEPLERIIAETVSNPAQTGIFNNAAQTWNHTFFWQSMRPEGGGAPKGALADKINASFGGFDKFKDEFANKATTLFGSGWTWLVASGDKLEVVQTSGAGTPVTDGKRPLLTLDVWEHAYYLDYQNRRPDFIKAFFDSLVNWDFAAKNLG